MATITGKTINITPHDDTVIFNFADNTIKATEIELDIGETGQSVELNSSDFTFYPIYTTVKGSEPTVPNKDTQYLLVHNEYSMPWDTVDFMDGITMAITGDPTLSSSTRYTVACNCMFSGGELTSNNAVCAVYADDIQPIAYGFFVYCKQGETAWLQFIAKNLSDDTQEVTIPATYSSNNTSIKDGEHKFIFGEAKRISGNFTFTTDEAINGGWYDIADVPEPEPEPEPTPRNFKFYQGKYIPLEGIFKKDALNQITFKAVPESQTINIFGSKTTVLDETRPKIGTSYDFLNSKGLDVKVQSKAIGSSGGTMTISSNQPSANPSIFIGEGYNVGAAYLLHGVYNDKEYAIPTVNDDKGSHEIVTAASQNKYGLDNYTYVSDTLVFTNESDLDTYNLMPYLEEWTDTPTFDDPYEKGGWSTQEGGNGTFDDASDDIDFSDTDLTDVDVKSMGIVKMYTGLPSVISLIAKKLWSKDFIDQINKLFSSPMDAIISLHILPFTPTIGDEEDVIIGNFKTAISLNVVTEQYAVVDCGNIYVDKFYDALWDYAPHTKIKIYLPFIGVRELNPDEVMGQVLALRYRVDCLTGDCVAEIKCGGSVLYMFNGNCAATLPLSSRDYGQFYLASINAIGQIGAAVATGGATAFSAGMSVVNALTSMKPNITHSGNVSGTVGLMSQQTPYLIYEIPRQSVPENNGDYNGYPSNITLDLKDISGYTVIRDIHLENIPALDSELDEIETILKRGVIL